MGFGLHAQEHTHGAGAPGSSYVARVLKLHTAAELHEGAAVFQSFKSCSSPLGGFHCSANVVLCKPMQHTKHLREANEVRFSSQSDCISVGTCEQKFRNSTELCLFANHEAIP